MDLKRKMSIILILSIFILTIKSSATTSSYILEGQKNLNVSTQNYEVYADIVKSYLYENTDKTISRVEYLKEENKILIETYDNSYRLKNTKKIQCSLPIFGGFYSGSKYNFLVLGQLNITEDNNLPVYRIEKYTKDWRKLEIVNLSNCNTVIPFDGGSCRMTEENGILYIETCHKMYKSSDGYRHQANLGIEINIENMEIIYARTNISYIGTGYVTHSFNQFIQAENGYSYTINHGDAYPRSIVLIKRGSGDIWIERYTDILEIPGTIGDNDTGTSVGGFELSENNCIVAGNSILKNTTKLNNKSKRNIFLSITPKESISKEQTQIIWLTNYSNESKINPSTPHLIKVKSNRLVVMWEENGENNTKTVKSVLIDENGNRIGTTISIRANLSDCKPILHNNNLIWHVSTEETKPIMFSIDLTSDTSFLESDGKINIKDEKMLLGDGNKDGEINTKDARIALLCYVGKEEITPEKKLLLDVNRDGEVDTKDARQILLHFVGKAIILN